MGVVILALSALLVVPAALGIAEYNRQPKIRKDGALVTEYENKSYAYYVVQCVILSVASLGVVLSIYLLVTKD